MTDGTHIPALKQLIWKEASRNLQTIVVAKTNIGFPHDQPDVAPYMWVKLYEEVKRLKKTKILPVSSDLKKAAEHELVIAEQCTDWWHRYERTYYSHIEKISPSVIKDGHYCPPKKPKADTANGLRSMMREFLYWSGHMGEGVNTMGKPVKRMIPKYNLLAGKVVMVEGGIDWHKSGVTKGSADFPAQIKNPKYPFAIPVKWEIKIGKDTQSGPQEKYQGKVEASGGLYFIVKKPDQFFDQFDYVMQL